MEIANAIAARLKTQEGGIYPVCLVCGRFCLFRHYYGIICCEACKKFFRRNAYQQGVSPCLNDLPCDVTKVKCRYCRYQKCLLVGMDPNFGKVKSAEKLDRFINGLKRIEQQFKRIWDSSRPLPEAYINRHQTVAGLLQDKYNLLVNADQFFEEPIGWDKARFVNEVETNGLFSLHALNIQYIKDWFIVLELAKAFPLFKELELKDQIVQLNHVGLPARLLINSFYSYSIGAKYVTRKNGIETIALLEARQICRDEKLRTLMMQCSRNLIEKISNCGLIYEEFLHLLAILISNSNADGLSPIGRKKLYQESIHYSKTLQTRLQCKFGQLGGAQKFAFLMDVLNCAIAMKFKFLSMFAYMEVFYTKKAMAHECPKIMQSDDAKQFFA